MARMAVGILTHADARKTLNGKGTIRIGHNTTLGVRYDTAVPSYAIRYHETDIVTIRPDGTYVLSSGGWHTPTTKQRINAMSPTWVYQHAYGWFLKDGTSFYDGMTVDSMGEIVK